MKNYIYGIFLAFICFMTPIYGEIHSTTQPLLTLNQLTYTPIHQGVIIDHTLYLSGEDFASMTYGHYTLGDTNERLTIQNHQFTYNSDAYAIQIDGITKSLKNATKTINGITYLPIEILDLIQYPYTLSDNLQTLSITPLLPYSTATDHVESHALFSTSYKNFSEVFSTFMDETATNDLVSLSKTNRSYISFMSTTYKSDCLKALHELVEDKNQLITVHFRQLDCSKQVPTLSTLVSLPLSYKISDEGLHFTLGDKQYTSPFFWSTYYPFQTDPIAIDLNKSLDVMIMRSIYAYYRDLYDLKDDLELSPVVTVKTGRSDQMQYRVYLDDAPIHTEYQVNLYRMTGAHTIDYYVDLMLS